MASPGDATTPAVPACQNRLDALNPYKQAIFSLLVECAETRRRGFDTNANHFKIGDNPVPSAGEYFGINFALVCARLVRRAHLSLGSIL
jgi:hypothetical protein